MTSEPLHGLVAHLRQLADPEAAPGVPDAELLRRFADGRDEAAFELLVWRHGGMVLATCRRVLGRSADAEDAFQATFLALVRRAGAVRRGVALAGWLHRVAVRAALRVRAAQARHPRAAGAAPDPPPDDTAAVLDEEIGRLPEKLRVAFVLCHLEGRTNEEAAARLGCPTGTVLSRLSRARERLRDRLARRGVGVPAAGLAALTAPTPLSAGSVGGVVRAAALLAAGRAGGAVPAHVLALTHGVLRAMRLNQLKPFAALVAAATLAAGILLAARPDTFPAPPRPVAAPPPAAAAPAKPPREFKLATADHGIIAVHQVRFSPDGRWLVTECTNRDEVYRTEDGFKTDSAVVVWDAATGKHAHTFEVGDGRLLDFCPGDKAPAVVGLVRDHSVILLEVGTWKKVATFKREGAENDWSFSPDGKLLVARSRDFRFIPGANGGEVQEFGSRVKVWDVATGKLRFACDSDADEAFVSAAFAPDGGTLAVGASRGVVHLIDVRTGKDRAVVQTPEEELVEAAFSPDGKQLLTWPATGPESVRAWDPATRKELFALEGFDDWCPRAAFSRDGKRVVARSRAIGAGRVVVWDAATGKRLAAVKLSDAPEPAAAAMDATFTPGGEHLVVLSEEKGGGDGPRRMLVTAAVLFALPGGKEVARLPGVNTLAIDHAKGAVALVTGVPLGSWVDGDPPDVVTVRDLAGLLNPAR